MNKLCLTLCRPTLAENLHDLKKNAPDLAELRIDLLEPTERESIASFPSQAGLPVILTCRKTCDGGKWEGSDSEREELLLQAMEGDFSFVDLEEDENSDVLERRALERRIRIIRSFHDFASVPPNLDERLEEMVSRGDLVKAAVMPTGIADLLTLFKIGRKWQESHPGEDNLILLGMGAYGVPSRILAQRVGSYLTFCSPDSAEAAPGHMSWKVLHDLYRVPLVEEDTRIFGIIGNPVLHTRSPHIHNPGFHKIGFNGVYVPFTVDDVSAFMKLAEFLEIRGFSVTVPHKLGIREFLDSEDDAVKAVSSCNTVVRDGESWKGYNTDVTGFIEPLLEKADSLKGKRAAVIGAGGAARAVVYALVSEGCDVSIFNRTLSRAEALAAELGGRGASLEELESESGAGAESGRYDLLVQTSSVGMHGTEGLERGEGNPVPFYSFTGDELVYDIIYTPPVTPLMQKAMDAGAEVLGGLPMLQAQGAAQFRLFTGKSLPE